MAEPLLLKIKDKDTRLQSARMTVMLRAWGGDTVGAKALGMRTLGGQDPAPFVFIGERIRACKDSKQTPTWQYAAQVAAEIPNMSRIIRPIMAQQAVMQLFYRGLRLDAIGLADCLPGDESRIESYKEIARSAGYAKDTDTLKALYPRIAPLVERIAPPLKRAEEIETFTDVYGAAGQSNRVIKFLETLPEGPDRAYRLLAWGEWQARHDPKAARKTLLEAAKEAGPIFNEFTVENVQLRIVRGLIEAGNKADAAALLTQTLAAVRAAPDKFNSDSLRASFVEPMAQTGDAAGAAQLARSLQSEPLQTNGLTLIALEAVRQGKLSGAMASALAAFKDRKARHNLLPRLVEQWADEIDKEQKRKFLALAASDSDRAVLLTQIALKQGTTDRAESLVTAQEALPWLAKIPPGLERTYAQRDAARLLVGSGRIKEAQALLLAAAAEAIRARKPVEPEKWRLPPDRWSAAAHPVAENEGETQLLDIAEAQSKAGDLEAALQTIRPLHSFTLRQNTLKDNVRAWMQSAAAPRDLAQSAKRLPLAERPYVLLAIAETLLIPLQMGPVYYPMIE